MIQLAFDFVHITTTRWPPAGQNGWNGLIGFIKWRLTSHASIWYPLHIKKSIVCYYCECWKLTSILNFNQLYLLTDWSNQQTDNIVGISVASLLRKWVKIYNLHSRENEFGYRRNVAKLNKPIIIHPFGVDEVKEQ